MWFLILEILFLLLLATVFGAWLAYWWLSRSPAMERNEEDERISRTDLEARFSELSTSISGLRNTDLSPLMSRLQALETRLANREPDADRLATRLVEIESKLANIATATSGLQNTDTVNIERQLGGLSEALAALSARDTAVDLAPLEARLDELHASIKTIEIPEIELGPIHSGLTRLEMSLDNLELPKPQELPDFADSFKGVRNDIGTLETRLAMIQQTLADDREATGAELNAKFADVTTRLENLPQPDMRSVDEGLSIVHGRLASLETSLGEQGEPENNQAIDALQQRFDQVQFELSRLERMEGAIGALYREMRQSTPNMEGIEQRLAILQADLDKQLSQDLTPVVNSVYAMERRMDMGSVQDRLTSIEFGLAALHQSMRTRMEQGEPAQRPRAPEPPVPSKTPPPAYMSAPPDAEPPYRPAPSARPSYTAPPPRETWPEYLPKPPAFEGRDMRYETRSYERPAPRPAPQTDAISEVRRPDDKANLLTRPAFGGPDALEDISGVGPMLHGLLNDIGVYYFWQIAEWGPEEVAWVDSLLDGFNGRIERDNWVGQAGILASRTDTANRP